MTAIPYSGQILALLADISRKPELAERLARDPLAVFHDYQIPPEKLALLRGRDAERIAAEVAREAQEVIQSLRKASKGQVGWPEPPTVEVATISPNKGPVGKVVNVKVTGKNFVKASTLTFKNPGATVQATVTDVNIDGNGNSTLLANATFTLAATYDVVVADPGTNQGPGTLSSGFTATPA